MKIRRSSAYGLAGAAVLGFSMLLPMSTPDWYGVAVLSLASALAGIALYFNARERKAGQQRSIGFFALAVLILIFALLCLLPLLV